MSNLSDIERLSFDSFERNPARDVVCLAPIRTMIRREEEITLVRRVRKVEEIDAGVGCPVNTTVISGPAPEPPDCPPPPPQICDIKELAVYADAGVGTIHGHPHPINGRKDLSRQEFVGMLQSRNLLPFIDNNQSQLMTVKITEIAGSWTYGPKESEQNRFDLEVGADGNLHMDDKERSEGDLLFPNLPPASLVAIKVAGNGEYTYVAHGSQMAGGTFTLQPGEKIYFICNDEPGFYYDNKNNLTVKWGILQ